MPEVPEPLDQDRHKIPVNRGYDPATPHYLGTSDVAGVAALLGP